MLMKTLLLQKGITVLISLRQATNLEKFKNSKEGKPQICCEQLVCTTKLNTEELIVNHSFIYEEQIWPTYELNPNVNSKETEFLKNTWRCFFKTWHQAYLYLGIGGGERFIKWQNMSTCMSPAIWRESNKLAIGKLPCVDQLEPSENKLHYYIPMK